MMCCPSSPKAIAGMLLRISVGASVMLVGIAHYMTFSAFAGMTRDGLGPLDPLGLIWAYILPALMIIGGALLCIGMFMEIGAWLTGIALASIPIGMLLKTVVGGVPLPEMMPMATTTFIWLLLFFMAVKHGGCCGCGGACGCGSKDKMSEKKW